MYPNFKWIDKWENRTMWQLHPYNLCLLSAMIEQKYDVKIVDANIDNLAKEEFIELIKAEKPDIICVSVLTNEYSESGLIAAKIAKEINPNIKLIFGGVAARSDPEPIIKCQYIDFVIFGEGEYVLKELCDHFNGDTELPKKGILYKKEDKIINLGRADFIKNLDEIPFPSYHKVDFMKYATKIQRESVDRPRDIPYAHILTSRGCPFNCCFCQVGTISGKIPRCRSPENIIAEIEGLIKDYGIKALILDDDNLLINRDRAKKIFELMIKKDFKLKWIAIALAAYKLDEELIDLMKLSGCQYVDIAIESGVERVLKDIIHKPVNLEYAKRMSHKIKEVGIDLAANFVIGFPGETWDEIRQTIKFAEELDADYTKIFIATPFPNTELYRLAKEKGYLKNDYGKAVWAEGYIETEEFRPQDLKILRAYEWDRLNFSNPKKKKKIAKMMDISESRLNEIRKETLKEISP